MLRNAVLRKRSKGRVIFLHAMVLNCVLLKHPKKLFLVVLVPLRHSPNEAAIEIDRIAAHFYWDAAANQRKLASVNRDFVLAFSFTSA